MDHEKSEIQDGDIPDTISSDISTDNESDHIKGWRLYLIMTGLLTGLYLVNLEVTIVSTALISITNDLNGFEQTSWIVTAFLTTYTAFMSQWTKLSNIAGRKKTLVAANIIFLAFSLGCGLARNMDQLIICRSLQGVGGAGVYSMVILCIYEVSPRTERPLYGAMAATVIALASLTGPIFGGLLAQNLAWRWTFYIHIPPGALAVLMLLVGLPSSFGTVTPQPLSSLLPSLTLFKKLDALGGFLLVSASLLLVTVLNETTIEFDWSSRTAIGLLALSGTLWIAFFLWEWTNFLCGCPWNVVIVYLAQRFQVVSNFSPLEAGIHIIPYSAVATVGTVLACLASRKFRIPVVYFAFLGSILHTVGMALLSILPEKTTYPREGYGYEAIAGAGVGITIGILTLAVPFVVETRDLATATGALNQARFLGGALGLAIASNILYGRLESHLSDRLSPEQVSEVLRRAGDMGILPKNVQEEAIGVFAGSYKVQFQAMIAFSSAQIPTSLLLFRRGGQYVAS
ncbi:major facilitator superfamily domain-containing protein [Penicillium verhagenii]|nr:major facilitator superfamily domain-containing protein [Penicillium verhagenii]